MAIFCLFIPANFRVEGYYNLMYNLFKFMKLPEEDVADLTRYIYSKSVKTAELL